MSRFPSCDPVPDLQMPKKRVKAYTLVEIFIIGLVLTIAMVLMAPLWSGAAQQPASKALQQDLNFMREQIDLYRAQHNHVSPGYATCNASSDPSAELFVEQMTRPTSDAGHAGSSSSKSFPFGPYLAEIPHNPLNGADKVLMVANDGSFPIPQENQHEYGWVFRAQTGELRAYVNGVDEKGEAYFNY